MSTPTDFPPYLPFRLLRRLVDEHGTQAAAAKGLGISTSYLCDLLAGRRQFSAAMLDKLGLERVVVKRKREVPQ